MSQSSGLCTVLLGRGLSAPRAPGTLKLWAMCSKSPRNSDLASWGKLQNLTVVHAVCLVGVVTADRLAMMVAWSDDTVHCVCTFRCALVSPSLSSRRWLCVYQLPCRWVHSKR